MRLSNPIVQQINPSIGKPGPTQSAIDRVTTYASPQFDMTRVKIDHDMTVFDKFGMPMVKNQTW